MTCTIHDIEAAVCARYNLSVVAIRSRRRLSRILRARQVAMYLARHLTPASTTLIGHHFEKDHTTVISAQRRIERLLRDSDTLADEIDGIREILAWQTPQRKIIADSVARGLSAARVYRPDGAPP